MANRNDRRRANRNRYEVDDGAEEMAREQENSQQPFMPQMPQGGVGQSAVAFILPADMASSYLGSAMGQQHAQVQPSYAQNATPVPDRVVDKTENRQLPSKNKGSNKNNKATKNTARHATVEDYTGQDELRVVKCCNCDGTDHFVRVCVGPVNTSTGMIHACPYCNTRNHILDECSHWPDHTDSKWEKENAYYMLESREGLPPFASSTDPRRHALAMPGEKYHNVLPLTAGRAWEYQKENPRYWEKYIYNKNPKLNIRGVRDLYWDDVNRVDQMPNSMNVIGHQSKAVVERQKRPRVSFDADKGRDPKRHNTGDGPSGRSKLECFKCRQKGHLVKNCPLGRPRDESNTREDTSGRQRTPQLGAFKCYNCHREGHMSRDCPDRESRGQSSSRDESPQRQESRQRQSANSRGNQKCYNCGQEGHISKGCKNHRQRRNSDVRENRENREPSRHTSARNLLKCDNCGKEGHISRNCKGIHVPGSGTSGGNTKGHAPAANEMHEHWYRGKPQPPDGRCYNCDGGDHDFMECPNVCGVCGLEGHRRTQCDEKEDKCNCSKCPRHIWQNCPLVCNQACIGEGEEHDGHSMITCVGKCCFCGAIVHEGQRCTATSWCLKCGSPKHPTAFHGKDCAKFTCCVNSCRKYFCKNHCLLCGFVGHWEYQCPNKVEEDASGNGIFWVKCPNGHTRMKLGSVTECSACAPVLGQSEPTLDIMDTHG